jgi:hypothetical protein
LHAYKILIWGPEGKRPLKKARRRWEYNIKSILQEYGLNMYYSCNCLMSGSSGKSI